MGLAGRAPGRVGLEAGRRWYETAWDTVPAEPGLDCHRHPRGGGRRPHRHAGPARRRSADGLPRPRAGRAGLAGARRSSPATSSCPPRRPRPTSSSGRRLRGGGRHHHEPRGPRQRPRPEGHAAGYRSGRLDDRGRPGPPARGRPAPRVLDEIWEEIEELARRTPASPSSCSARTTPRTAWSPRSRPPPAPRRPPTRGHRGRRHRRLDRRRTDHRRGPGRPGRGRSRHPRRGGRRRGGSGLARSRGGRAVHRARPRPLEDEEDDEERLRAAPSPDQPGPPPATLIFEAIVRPDARTAWRSTPTRCGW